MYFEREEREGREAREGSVWVCEWGRGYPEFERLRSSIFFSIYSRLKEGMLAVLCEWVCCGGGGGGLTFF